jgi:ferritin-like metal-binding protein YciE
MQTIDQLFVAELKDALGTEQTVAAALQQLSQCQSDPQLRQTFGAHHAETQTQIERLEQVLSTLGESPAPTFCEGMQGIVDEHSAFTLKNSPSPQVHTAYDIGAGQKVEQYEIATYEQLVTLANRLGYQQVAQLLEQSLTEERQQLQRLQTIDVAAPAMAGQQRIEGQQSIGQQQQPIGQQPTAQRPQQSSTQF